VSQAAFASESSSPGVSEPLRTLVARVPEEILVREINPHTPPERDLRGSEEAALDPVVQRAGANLGRTPSLLSSFEGLGTVGPLPPDTSGDVGPDHYVQMVNIRLAVYDKNGTRLIGPVSFNDLYQGLGGECEGHNDGDPIVLYDELADRWLLSQFYRVANGGGMCIAISQTGDPTGAYFLYEFRTPQFPDYPKFGVWPDGYYMSDNGGRPNRYSAYVFDRERMLAGQPATFQSFTGFANFMMPSDLDGETPPPAGAPNYFYTFKDNARHGGIDRLEIYTFDVDWASPANTQFVLATTLPIASFNYTVCGFFVQNCIPQPGTSQGIDSLSYWPMWRFPYRNLGDHEVLVGNFTVDVDGADRAGIRWFELRKQGDGSWGLFQEATFAPDENHRFMGSIAADRDGNVALGYSVSGQNTFPSIRYAMRLADDPAGTLQAEATLQAGGGSQTHQSGRWGDYSTMSVDPSDDCTFWYTNQYYQATASGSWRTRVGTFRSEQCGRAEEEEETQPAAYEYAVKLVCGVQKDAEDLRLARGVYATVINVRNPNADEVELRKELALAIPPGEQQPGEVQEIARDVLRPGQALAVDCVDVQRRVFGGSWPADYVDGFVVLQSKQPLDVIAVYTTLALDRDGNPVSHSSTDVEHVPARIRQTDQ
jgi:hypothetical protein